MEHVVMISTHVEANAVVSLSATRLGLRRVSSHYKSVPWLIRHLGGGRKPGLRVGRLTAARIGCQDNNDERRRIPRSSAKNVRFTDLQGRAGRTGGTSGTSNVLNFAANDLPLQRDLHMQVAPNIHTDPVLVKKIGAYLD